jgi:predicted MFS family arabinose efflux permease
VKAAASLAILACGFAAAMWWCAWPAPGGARPELGMGLVAGSLTAGPLIDRRSRKAVLIAGLALLGGASWGLTAAPDAWMRPLVAALGLGAGMTLLAGNALVCAAGGANRAQSLNLIGILLPVGAILTPAFGTGSLALAAGVVSAVALAVAAWTPMAGRAPLETAAAGKRPAIPLLALLLFLYAACEAGVWGWLVEYWGVARVLDHLTAWLILCYGLPLGLMAGRAASARLLAAIAPLTLLRFAGLAMAFATGLMLLARSPSASCVAAFAVGLAMAPVLPTTLAVAAGALPGRPATGMGMALAAGWLGMAASSPLIAWIAGRSSLQTAMLLLPVLSLAAAQVAMAMTPRNRPRVS